MHAITKSIDAGYQHPPEYSVSEIESCLTPRCWLRIEHAARIGPGGGDWKPWQPARIHDGDVWQLCADIDRCCAVHGRDYVRLCIDDLSFRSQRTLMVQSPWRDS